MRKLFILPIILVGFFFLSCDTGYYYQRSTLDVPITVIETDRNGYFHYEIPLTIDDFTNVDALYDEIKSAQLISSILWIEGRLLRPGDEIQLKLTYSNRSISVLLPVDNFGYTEITDEDSGYRSFMNNMANYIVKGGKTTLTASGTAYGSNSRPISNVQFDFAIINDIDLQVRK